MERGIFQVDSSLLTFCRRNMGKSRSRSRDRSHPSQKGKAGTSPVPGRDLGPEAAARTGTDTDTGAVRRPHDGGGGIGTGRDVGGGARPARNRLRPQTGSKISIRSPTAPSSARIKRLYEVERLQEIEKQK